MFLTLLAVRQKQQRGYLRLLIKQKSTVAAGHIATDNAADLIHISG
jgi:hypothetical protein